MFYIDDIPEKTECVGNTLSTINIALTSLDSAIQELSASQAFKFDQIYAFGDAVIKYDYDLNGDNAFCVLSTNCMFDNISSISDGQAGKFMLHISPTTGVTVTAWGSQWRFHDDYDTFTWTASAKNLIEYYHYDDVLYAKNMTFTA
jgi:hypothetical protein